jgi:hypothetical protein
MQSHPDLVGHVLYVVVMAGLLWFNFMIFRSAFPKFDAWVLRVRSARPRGKDQREVDAAFASIVSTYHREP